MSNSGEWKCCIRLIETVPSTFNCVVLTVYLLFFFSSAPSVLTLTAVKHLLSGIIKTLTQTNDIAVNIK